MAKSTKQEFVVKFAHERDTKGAAVYSEVDDAGKPLPAADGGKMGTIYIRKRAFDGSPPKTLTATFVAGD